MSPRLYADRDDLWEQVRQRAPKASRKEFEAVCNQEWPGEASWEEFGPYDDEGLRIILSALSEAQANPRGAQHDEQREKQPTRNKPDTKKLTTDRAAETRTEIVEATDPLLMPAVEKARRDLFEKTDIPFPDDPGAAAKWIHFWTEVGYQHVQRDEYFGEDDEARDKAKEGGVGQIMRVRVPNHEEDWHKTQRPARLSHYDADGLEHSTLIYRNSKGQVLYEAAQTVADIMSVEMAQAVSYILTGKRPIRAPIRVEKRPSVLPDYLFGDTEPSGNRLRWHSEERPGYMVARAEIVITVSDPNVDPEDVMAAYVKARDDLWKVGRTRLQDRDPDFVGFVDTNQGPRSWADLLREWNRLHPDKAFDGIYVMRTAYRRARDRVFPKDE